jgi:hypothetical protein
MRPARLAYLSLGKLRGYRIVVVWTAASWFKGYSLAMARKWTIEYAPPNMYGFFMLDSIAAEATGVWAIGDASGPAMIARGGGGQPWGYSSYPPNLVNMRLDSVTSLKPDDIWAVGYDSMWDYYLTYAAHYDGTSWTRVPTPDPHDGVNYLFGVAGYSSSDVWAVGTSATNLPNPIPYFPPPRGPFEALAIHWDGSAWSRVACPAHGQEACLQGVATTGADEAWSVGVWVEGSPPLTEALLMHWERGEWQQVKSPTFETSQAPLWGVAGLAPEDVWAVGEGGYPNGRALTMHWDGVEWSLIPTPPTPERSWLRGVACAGPSDAWAVGTQFVNSEQQLLILHWDGQGWSAAQAPSPTNGGRAWLTGVTVAGDGIVWACGYYSDPNNAYHMPLVLSYQ